MHTTPRPDTSKDTAWVVTTQTAPWRMRGGPAVEASEGVPDVIVQTERPRQTIEGFGACFNELGWTPLVALDVEHAAEAIGEGRRITVDSAVPEGT